MKYLDRLDPDDLYWFLWWSLILGSLLISELIAAVRDILV